MRHIGLIGDLSLKALTFDAAENGTINGFSFAEHGTVRMMNLGPEAKALTIDGERPVNRRLVVDADGKVRIVTRGLTVVVR